MTVPIWFWCVTTFLFGICIGSFMNVVIWRLPRDGSLTEPQWSYCPYCSHRLTASDLVPLLSFLARGRKCRYCQKPISSRYFWVELLTGVLFVVLYFHFRNEAPNAVAAILFGALLVPIFCIDLETFEIPSQLNLLAFVVAIGRDVYGIVVHEPGHALMWHWLPVSILGAVAGVGIFGTVRVIGWLWKRQEAMGLGDVLLARAMGAMLVSYVPAAFNPLRLMPIWVLLCCGSGAVIGQALLKYRHKQAAALLASGGTLPASDDEEEPPEDESSLALELADIGYVLWLGDAFDYIRTVFSRHKTITPALVVEEDVWTPAPTAIPFGPFMVVGFLVTLLVGEPITAMYLTYAIPKAISAGPNTP